ncbi:ketosteroid isomerase-like protein [Amycolatopsis sulphurea]|uniref:Ketosteroid isomerase-like protein n=1 Tax=Amycolatopsis sulphurea TaxID=76022 RepID=A0A2A9G0Q3_9PSEU|nr:nuclear transport factor 2 family protein [Amycolatopsis sulphurea]PFG57307.1 ketosteroid isomerase-like protein [Amycolatopsis sulphurea]
MTDAACAENAVRRYYGLVDAGDIDGLVALFDEQAVYRRPGYPPLNGHEALRAFYRSRRVIAEGRHTVVQVLVHDRTAAVRGSFRGVLKDGGHCSVRFADFFLLSERHRFLERETYFFQPSI